MTDTQTKARGYTLDACDAIIEIRFSNCTVDGIARSRHGQLLCLFTEKDARTALFRVMQYLQAAAAALRLKRAIVARENQAKRLSAAKYGIGKGQNYKALEPLPDVPKFRRGFEICIAGSFQGFIENPDPIDAQEEARQFLESQGITGRATLTPVYF